MKRLQRRGDGNFAIWPLNQLAIGRICHLVIWSFGDLAIAIMTQ